MLLPIMLLVLLVLLCTLLGKRFEQLLAPLVCATTLLLYVLAMFQALYMAQWIVLVGAIGAFAVTILRAFKKQGKMLLGSFASNVFTPGFLAFVMLGVIYFIASRWHIVYQTDDFHYWSLQVHSLFARGGLVDASLHLSPRFMTYTPGLQLYQWIAISANGEWSEPLVFFMLYLSYAIFTLPFTSRITWKKVYLLPVYLLFALILPVVFTTDAYAMLRVDTILGICFGYALMQAWLVGSSKEHATFHLICFTLALCMLVLIKQIGIAWALMAIAMLLLVRKPVKRTGVKPSALVGACIAPLIVLGSWLLFSKLNNLSGEHLNNIAAQTQRISSGAWSPIAAFLQLFTTLIQVFFNTQASLQATPILELPLVCWVGLVVLIPLVLIPFYRNYKRLLISFSVWSFVCFLLYYIGYESTLLTAFYSEEAMDVNTPFFLALTKRYFCPYLIGLVMLLFTAALDSLKRVRQKTPLYVLGTCVFAILLVFTSWSSLKTELSTQAYEGYAQNNPLEEYIYEGDWLSDLYEPQDAVVLYGTNSIPYVPERMQYAIAPAKLVLLRDESISPEDFVQFLRTNRITHVVCMDEDNAVYRNAIGYEEYEWIDIATVYDVSWDGDAPILAY